MHGALQIYRHYSMHLHGVVLRHRNNFMLFYFLDCSAVIWFADVSERLQTIAGKTVILEASDGFQALPHLSYGKM
jgi:hypothetical protein